MQYISLPHLDIAEEHADPENAMIVVSFLLDKTLLLGV
tara:strand:+ start:396 stop:509 length:114 start_codon:yes stop_codon:yes gene_type:complete